MRCLKGRTMLQPPNVSVYRPFKWEFLHCYSIWTSRNSTKRGWFGGWKERFRLMSPNGLWMLGAWLTLTLLPRVLGWPDIKLAGWPQGDDLVRDSNPEHEQWQPVPVQKHTSEIKSAHLKLHLLTHQNFGNIGKNIRVTMNPCKSCTPYFPAPKSKKRYPAIARVYFSP